MNTDLTNKTRYSDEELKMFDAVIDEKLAFAQNQLDNYLEQIKELADSDDAKVKDMDNALSSTEHERLYEMAGRQKKMIQHLNNAKLRISNKVYGICRETGMLIAKERLMAVPHTTLSVLAKEKR